MTNHEGHIKLWDELARTGAEDKEEAFVTLFPDIDQADDAYQSRCFACVEAGNSCGRCPINWGMDVDGCCGAGSPYTTWEISTDPEERKRLAPIIRDLEWKEKT
jgi:hypothetical protein